MHYDDRQARQIGVEDDNEHESSEFCIFPRKLIVWLSFCQEILTHKFLNISTSFAVVVYVRLSPGYTFSVAGSVLKKIIKEFE